MKMVALKEFRYAGKQIDAGTEFDARDQDVRILEAIKKASPKGSKDADSNEQMASDQPERKRPTKRRDVQAD